MTNASTTEKSITYGYDHSGQRVKLNNGSITTVYSTKYYSTDGTTPTKHIYLPDGTLIATVTGSNASSTVQYIHTDHLGGTNVVTDDSGQVVELVDSYPYGRSRLDEKAGDFSERYKFAQLERDDDTGLDYAQARYYNNSRGQFVSQDPEVVEKLEQFLDDPQQMNYYAYARNNPLAYSDPTGRLSYSEVLAGAPSISWQQVVAAAGQTAASAATIMGYAMPFVAPVTIGVVVGGTTAFGGAAGFKWVLSGPDSIGNQTTPTSLLDAPKAEVEDDTDNSNPFVGPVDKPVIVVDPKGNAIPVGEGEQIHGSPDGEAIQVKDSQGKPTGTRIDKGHPSSPKHQDPRSQQPHAHRPGVLNPDGTPWLPIK